MKTFNETRNGICSFSDISLFKWHLFGVGGRHPNPNYRDTEIMMSH